MDWFVANQPSNIDLGNRLDPVTVLGDYCASEPASVTRPMCHAHAVADRDADMSEKEKPCHERF
ncbi:MAG: hypothetical protein JOY98_00715 [Candidatus Eremiobacteraeota bacterium]|nr:hypothetical protein [Candidatus Eremiobacteraeota bacterium]